LTPFRVVARQALIIAWRRVSSSLLAIRSAPLERVQQKWEPVLPPDTGQNNELEQMTIRSKIILI
jgi:hypothetical protein